MINVHYSANILGVNYHPTLVHTYINIKCINSGQHTANYKRILCWAYITTAFVPRAMIRLGNIKYCKVTP